MPRDVSRTKAKTRMGGGGVVGVRDLLCSTCAVLGRSWHSVRPKMSVCLKCKNAVNAVSEDTLCIGVYMYAVSGSVSARFSSHIGSLVHKQAVRKQASILLTHFFFSQPWERVNPRVNPRIVTTHMKLYM